MTDLIKETVIRELKAAFWDYKINPDELYIAVANPDNDYYPIDKKFLFSRLLTGMEWYSLIKLVPQNKWKDLFSEEIIQRIWPKSLQNKYRYAGKKLLDA